MFSLISEKTQFFIYCEEEKIYLQKKRRLMMLISNKKNVEPKEYDDELCY